MRGVLGTAGRLQKLAPAQAAFSAGPCSQTRWFSLAEKSSHGNVGESEEMNEPVQERSWGRG